MTSFPGFDSPAIGFEAPFDMPEACHGRMRRSLGLPNCLVACVDEHGLAAMSIDVQRRRLVTTPFDVTPSAGVVSA